jgi:hypothetical protein
MNNFKVAVAQANMIRYPWPEGWQRNADVAKELGVSSDRVGEILKPALDQGLVERQVFPVWNTERNRVDRIVGWRTIDRKQKTK